MSKKKKNKGKTTVDHTKELQKQLTDLEQKSDELTKKASKLSMEMEKLLADDIATMKSKEKGRGAEILSIFAKHNFYIGGFTPVELRTTLEDLGPTYVKIGQIMSSRVDMLPENYCKELEKLRQNVQPLDPLVARAVIEQETGRRIDEIFQEFRNEPLGSASIGQAHYGVLKDGTKVVVKVQRPLIADMMRKDFVLLKKFAKMINVVKDKDENNNSVVDLLSVIEELETVTEEELNFQVEADNTRFFKENAVTDEKVVTCPTIIDELSTTRIMTMTFVDGCSIAKKDKLIEQGLDCNELGKSIIDNYLHQVLDVGVFHGDPHQGNIMVSNGTIYWIDFGMIGRISNHDIDVFQQLILAVIEMDLDSLVSGIMSLGACSSKTSRDKLVQDVDDFIERYSSVSDISSLDTAAVLEEITDIANDNYVTLPGSYTMLARSLATIEGVLEELCSDLSFFEYLADKLMARVKKSFDIQQELLSAGKDALAISKKAARIPVLASDALKNIVKGKAKINLELTGYEDLVNTATQTVRSVILALFACILFFGSCILCLSDLQPKTSFGMPLLAAVGFLFSISLAIYTVKLMSKKK